MLKVLIFSSKELFDKSSYEGRAEAHVIAYREDDFYYKVVKNRTSTHYLHDRVPTYQMARNLEWIERDIFNKELNVLVGQSVEPRG